MAQIDINNKPRDVASLSKEEKDACIAILSEYRGKVQNLAEFCAQYTAQNGTRPMVFFSVLSF